jgi:hypothetical protein
MVHLEISPMRRLPFNELPVLCQIVTLGGLFAAWVGFEELVIDRHGWDRWLPLYRYGNLCIYDFAVFSVIVVVWAAFLREPRNRP